MLGLGLGINKNKVLNINHVSTWNTTNTSAGSSNSDQIKIPVENGGTYDCVVYWGDGSSDYITTWNDPAWTHTYTSSGTKRIVIKGTFEGFRFNDTGDKLKLLSIDKWGKDFILGNNNSYFYGCANMQISENCGDLNVTGLIDATNMFRSCTNFNSNMNWLDTTNIETMVYMFFLCIKFNKPLSHFNISNCKQIDSILRYCTNFNQDISSWDISEIVTANNCLKDSNAWSTENYDKFLISAAGQSVQSGVTFVCSSNYTLGGDAEVARTSLINDDSWSITDAGGI